MRLRTRALCCTGDSSQWIEAKCLVSDGGHFDPAHPDSAAPCNLPLSPVPFEEKPED